MTPNSFLRPDMARKISSWPPSGIDHMEMTAQSHFKSFPSSMIDIPMNVCLLFLLWFLSQGIQLRHSDSFKSMQDSTEYQMVWRHLIDFWRSKSCSQDHQRIHKNPKSQDHALSIHERKKAHRHRITTWHSPIMIHEHKVAKNHGSMIRKSP